jgi:hypothetical protein
MTTFTATIDGEPVAVRAPNIGEWYQVTDPTDGLRIGDMVWGVTSGSWVPITVNLATVRSRAMCCHIRCNSIPLKARAATIKWFQLGHSADALLGRGGK